ncbi:efflux RND transporter permease subunit [uncultured Paraglaciecola sp.]|uniref:efflux RND transporter permease subunit n=1 Tax=uncultured Paraglaciecola sp. TaxID=1765024 RepID=UPI0030DA7C1B|tara:strand:+ start:5783 stop:8212 length:2430 start_codon:yes stop_codon:yes gene_type:complete
MSASLANMIIRHAKLILLLFVIGGGLAAWSAQQFKIDASADTLLIKNNKMFVETQVMNERFSPQEFILVAYKPKDRPVFSQQSFNDIQQISSELKTLPRVAEVTNILNVPLLSLSGELDPDLKPDQLTWQANHYSADKMREVFTDHPLFTDLLVNKDQTATAMQIVFKPNTELRDIQSKIIGIQQKVLDGELSEQDEQRIDKLKRQAEPIEEQLKKTRQQEIKQIYQIIEPFKDDADLYLGGAYVLGQQMIDIIQSDLLVFGSAIGLAICLILFVLFRKIRWVVLPLLCCGLSVLLTVGLFGLLDFRATVISSNFIALQLILTLAVVVHLIVEFRQLEEQDSEASQQSLLRQTFINKFKPCLYAGITTSVGFASLLFSGIQPVVSFGWMMIVAMGVSISVSLLLFPAVLASFKRKGDSHESRFSQYVVSAISNFTLRRPTFIVLITLIISGGAIFGILKLNVENSFLNYFKESTQVRTELEFIDREFGGSTPLDLIYTIPENERRDDLVMSAKTIQTLQKIQHVMRQYKATGNITSVVNFTELAKQINNGKPLTEYELTVIYTLLDESLTDQLLGAYFDPENNQLRISTRIQDSTENFNRAEFLKTLRNDLEMLDIAPDSYSLSNLFVLYQDILQRLFSSQIMTLGLVFGALTLVLLVIFRSIKVAVIAVIPNILTTLVILGVMGWLGIALDLMTITISAIAMGIAVDDTIHFVHRYLEEINKENADASKAIKRTFKSVGYALIYTTTIIAVGFSLLSFSDFVPSILFGLLTCLAMVLAFVTDTTLLPVLLRKFVHPKSQKKASLSNNG